MYNCVAGLARGAVLFFKAPTAKTDSTGSESGQLKHSFTCLKQEQYRLTQKCGKKEREQGKKKSEKGSMFEIHDLKSHLKPHFTFGWCTSLFLTSAAKLMSIAAALMFQWNNSQFKLIKLLWDLLSTLYHWLLCCSKTQDRFDSRVFYWIVSSDLRDMLLPISQRTKQPYPFSCCLCVTRKIICVNYPTSFDISKNSQRLKTLFSGVTPVL